MWTATRDTATIIDPLTAERDFSARVTFARAHRGLSARAAERPGGLPSSTVAGIEARVPGRTLPHLQTATRVALGLDTPLAWLFAPGEPVEPPEGGFCGARPVLARRVAREFGRRLSLARVRQGSSAQEVAFRAGLPGADELVRYEAGREVPRLPRLFALAEVLEVERAWLAGEGSR